MHTHPMRWNAAVAPSSFVALALALAACGGQAPDAAASGTTHETIGEKGQMLFAVTPTQPVAAGANAFRVCVQSAAGAPMQHATLTVDAWMPAMGHGSPVGARISDAGAGCHQVDDVMFTMGGTWIVRCRATDGAIADAIELAYDVR